MCARYVNTLLQIPARLPLTVIFFIQRVESMLRLIVNCISSIEELLFINLS